MKDFIKEFYYGNIDPQARSIKQSKAVMKEMQTLNETEEYLTAKLKGEEKSKFLDHVNAWSVVNGESNLDSFIVGFRIGAMYFNTFPYANIWTQCCFDNNSLMLSVADIPFLGIHFRGIIGIILLDGKEYRIATYLGARIKQVEKNTVTVKQGNFEFTARLLKKNAQPLAAPTNGDMCRTIHESAACEAYYRFSHKK